MKKETLEEVAENHYDIIAEEPKKLTELEIAIKLEEIEREEWEQERMYSEEDMIEFGKFCHSEAYSVNRVKTFKEWFEQFKKK
jgi:hypothetical protein